MAHVRSHSRKRVYTLGLRRKIAHSGLHAETGAFLPSATAWLCAASEIHFIPPCFYTKEQVIGDVSFENATASANGKVTVTLAAAPSNPILVIITSIAL